MPGLKYSWHKINLQGFEAPSDDNALGALTLAEINDIHGKTLDGKLLPSLTVMYAFNPEFHTYLQYKTRRFLSHQQSNSGNLAAS